MLVDCDRCAVRGAACADCMVTVLLGPPAEVGAAARGLAEEPDPASIRAGGRPDCPAGPEVEADIDLSRDFDLVERRALAALAEGGLIPPLRLVPAVRPESAPAPCDVAHDQSSARARSAPASTRKRLRGSRLAG